jgi:hypothetical protein
VSGLAATGTPHESEQHRPLREHSPAMVIGVLSGGVAVVSALFASNADDARMMLGTLLAGIGFVYVGFAVSDGRKSAIVIQSISALVFLWAAQIGIREESNLVLGLGFVAHGVWDALHHEHHGWAEVRWYYPPFCAMADFAIAAAILTGLAV